MDQGQKVFLSRSPVTTNRDWLQGLRLVCAFPVMFGWIDSCFKMANFINTKTKYYTDHLVENNCILISGYQEVFYIKSLNCIHANIFFFFIIIILNAETRWGLRSLIIRWMD